MLSFRSASARSAGESPFVVTPSAGPYAAGVERVLIGNLQGARLTARAGAVQTRSLIQIGLKSPSA